jgi:CDP-diacylglycerol--serine O-phosphatidyltransferase
VTRWFPALAHANTANLITLVAAACGLGAVVAAAQGASRAAVVLLAAAILGDRLDGAVARRLGQTSDFGRELDSLADAVGFCLAPALLGVLRGLPAWAVAAARLYTLAGLWRLAHFNVNGPGRRRPFTGVPTTIAASFFLLASVAVERTAAPVAAVLTIVYLGLAALMVSGLRFPKHGLCDRCTSSSRPRSPCRSSPDRSELADPAILACRVCSLGTPARAVSACRAC